MVYQTFARLVLVIMGPFELDQMHGFIKGELNPKIKFVVFGKTLKTTVRYLSVFDSLASFLRYFSFSDMQITHMTYATLVCKILFIFFNQSSIILCLILHLVAVNLYLNVMYLCYYKTKSLQNVHMCLVSWEKHTHMITSK